MKIARRLIIVFSVIVILTGLTFSYLYFTNNTITFGQILPDLSRVKGIGYSVSDQHVIIITHDSDPSKLQKLYDELKDVEFKKYFGGPRMNNKISDSPIIIVQYPDEKSVWDFSIYPDSNFFTGFNLVKSRFFFADYYRPKDIDQINSILAPYISEYHSLLDNLDIEETSFTKNNFVSKLDNFGYSEELSLTTTDSPLSVNLTKISFGSDGVLWIYFYPNDKLDLLEQDWTRVQSDGTLSGNSVIPSMAYYKRGNLIVSAQNPSKDMTKTLDLIFDAVS